MSNKEKKTLVVALGGNAIKQADQEGTTQEQFENVRETAKAIFKIIEEGEYKVIVTHGNGPQAGALLIQQEDSDRVPAQDMHVVGAMTQGQIGYMIQQELENELRKNDMEDVPVSTVINQVRVDEDDPEFEGENASKPVGPFYTEEEAKRMADERGYLVKEVDPSAEKSWRRVVPSPEPIENMEADAISRMVNNGIVVIASGGGGIPVVNKEGELKGVPAVIDKDRAGEKLAEVVNADKFMVLTDVEHARLNFGEPDEEKIEEMTVKEAQEYMDEGHFLAGSMGPKVQACMRFAENQNGEAIITHLDKSLQALEGKTGTHIIKE